MPEKTTISGVLNIDKPAGVTSHDVVAHVRRLTHPATSRGVNYQLSTTKVGHTGTLDPFATGVLLVVIGSATRLIQFSHQWDKEYEATFTLGATSDMDDITGRMTKSKIPMTNQIPMAKIQKALQEFVGKIEQRPPAYSAVKVKGKKLYEYARAGLPAGESKARSVIIHEITITRYDYPELDLFIRCGTGTYIRSLARDLGKKLGTGAYVSSLRRTRIGPFSIADSRTLPQLSTGFQQHIHNPATLVSHLASLTLTSHNIEELRQGKGTPLGAELTPPIPSVPLAIFDEKKVLVGIAAYDPTAALLFPSLNL